MIQRDSISSAKLHNKIAVCTFQIINFYIFVSDIGANNIIACLKGNPVQVWNYPRSCKFQLISFEMMPLSYLMGRLRKRKQVRRPAISTILY